MNRLSHQIPGVLSSNLIKYLGGAGWAGRPFSGLLSAFRARSREAANNTIIHFNIADKRTGPYGLRLHVNVMVRM
jgi:hypothetical protein